jgi:hypothetical protein
VAAMISGPMPSPWATVIGIRVDIFQTFPHWDLFADFTDYTDSVKYVDETSNLSLTYFQGLLHTFATSYLLSRINGDCACP